MEPVPVPATLPAMFQASAQRRGNAPALKARAEGGWRTITWAGYARYVQDLACFLLVAGIRKGDRVALLARNGPEWAIADLATLHAGAATAALYETLLPERVAHILRDSGARLAIVGTAAQAEALLTHASSLEVVVCAEATKGALGKQVVDWDEALRSGQAWARDNPTAFEERWRGVTQGDLASLIYTSGTTGEPKGAMLTHGNFTSNVADTLRVVPVRDTDVLLSFLPLSHSFERMAGLYCPTHAGALVAFARNVEGLADDLLDVRPTIMNAVPKLFERVWQRVEAGAREEGKEKAFARAVEVGREHIRATLAEGRSAPVGLELKYRAVDRLAFGRVRDRLGGRVRFFVSGGAHIREELEWNFAAVGMPILGGYGLTEAGPVVAVNTLEAWRPGSVGKPIPNVEVRIAEDGEILVRGPNVMSGYWNREEETRATLRDGWLHTGDLGHLDDEGFLYVTDRKKELFKTTNGKYVAPQPIEDALRSSPLIAEAVCLGDGRPLLGALIVPDFAALETWARTNGAALDPRDALLADPRVQEALRAEVERVNARLEPHERIRKVRVLDHELTQAAGELTPTLKVKRSAIAERYSALIESMFA